MKWFKFYGQDFLTDPKMLSLSACERSCWITLLSYASVNDNGMITFLDETQLMVQAGISLMSDEWDYTKGVLEKFKNMQMITLETGKITVLNWQKRQETSLTSYERVKKFREKKRNETLNDNDRIEENRIDKKRIDTTKTSARQAVGDEIKEIKSPIESEAKREENKLVADVLLLFSEVNPNYKLLYSRPPQRSAVARMLKEHGEEKIMQIIKLLPVSNKEQFAPVITTPAQLEARMGDLAVWWQRKKVEKSKNLIGIAI